MRPTAQDGRRLVSSERRRGVALFVVLAMAALLASLVGAAMRTGVSGARAAAAFADAVRADELGRGVGELMSYRLATGPADVFRGGRLAVRLPDAEITVDYLSESARVDANAAPIALIAALLTAAGADASLVDAVSDHIKLTRPKSVSPSADGSDGPPAQAPASAAPAASPPSGPPDIQNALDIVRAWGLPEDVARRVIPALTVANGSKQVDPLLAGRLVLLALLGGDEDRADDYMARRAQGFTNAASALALLPVPSQAFAGFSDAKAVRAVARVRIAKRFERSYEMILVQGQRAGQRPTVVSWRKLL